MQTSMNGAAEWYEWSRSTYNLRIRAGKHVYLWGSAGFDDIKFSAPLILHIRNELFGHPVTLATKKKSGAHTKLGTLEPGECVSIPINDVCGLFATSTDEATVNCRITK
jgi:hypothetical protein